MLAWWKSRHHLQRSPQSMGAWFDQFSNSHRVSLRLVPLSWRSRALHSPQVSASAPWHLSAAQQSQVQVSTSLLRKHPQPVCLWGPSEVQALEPPPAAHPGRYCCCLTSAPQILPAPITLLLSPSAPAPWLTSRLSAELGIMPLAGCRGSSIPCEGAGVAALLLLQQQDATRA